MTGQYDYGPKHADFAEIMKAVGAPGSVSASPPPALFCGRNGDVLFFDTPDRRPYSNAFILRRRIALSMDFRLATPTFEAAHWWWYGMALGGWRVAPSKDSLIAALQQRSIH